MQRSTWRISRTRSRRSPRWRRPRQFRREHYERLPGKSPLKEFLADIGAPALSAIGLKERAFWPASCRNWLDYWLGSNSRSCGPQWRDSATPSANAIERGDDVLLISHCIGSVIAYDALWSLSRGGYRDGRCAPARSTTWLTIGAPLGDESVKRRLEGAGADGAARYPNNILSWVNVAAEDDYVCHDDRLANDYARHARATAGQPHRRRAHLQLAVRYGRSNPHNAFGYLIHPRISRAIAQVVGRADRLTGSAMTPCRCRFSGWLMIS